MGSQEIPLGVRLRASCCAELCKGVAMGSFSECFSEAQKGMVLKIMGGALGLLKDVPEGPLLPLSWRGLLGLLLVVQIYTLTVS